MSSQNDVKIYSNAETVGDPNDDTSSEEEKFRRKAEECPGDLYDDVARRDVETAREGIESGDEGLAAVCDDNSDDMAMNIGRRGHVNSVLEKFYALEC